jgi:hypothetical protein
MMMLPFIIRCHSWLFLYLAKKEYRRDITTENVEASKHAEWLRYGYSRLANGIGKLKAGDHGKHSTTTSTHIL